MFLHGRSVVSDGLADVLHGALGHVRVTADVQGLPEGPEIRTQAVSTLPPCLYLRYRTEGSELFRYQTCCGAATRDRNKQDLLVSV